MTLAWAGDWVWFGGASGRLMGRRTKARECAVQMLYQWDITRDAMDLVVESFWRVRSTTEETKAMAERLARGARSRLEELDGTIAANLANWRFDRVAAVDRNILRVAAYELVCEAGTPASVILDEAVEMAKRFGEADSPAFVNGVLDAVMRQVRGAQGTAQVRGACETGPAGDRKEPKRGRRA